MLLHFLGGVWGSLRQFYFNDSLKGLLEFRIAIKGTISPMESCRQHLILPAIMGSNTTEYCHPRKLNQA